MVSTGRGAGPLRGRASIGGPMSTMVDLGTTADEIEAAWAESEDAVTASEEQEMGTAGQETAGQETAGDADGQGSRSWRDFLGGQVGMTTAEYAVGTVAACGAGGVLVKLLTGSSMSELLWKVVEKAFSVIF